MVKIIELIYLFDTVSRKKKVLGTHPLLSVDLSELVSCCWSRWCSL